ncbi:Protein F11C1.1 [Aphelenchoides avenae]|nr:Protein F11C1.1 [Aphelenchus avenae]
MTVSERPSASISSSENNSKDKVLHLSEEEYFAPIKDEYAKRLSEMSPDEIYDNYNPGPTKPDGSVNFECHCVSHLVASPCGYYFRKAITCQKTATDEEMEQGKCSDEFMEFMRCAVRTQCFRVRDDKDAEEEKDAPFKS